jgi:signal transduction histidine kinase
MLFTATALVATPLATTGGVTAPVAAVALLCLAGLAVSVQAFRRRVDDRWGALALVTLSAACTAVTVAGATGDLGSRPAVLMTSWLTSGMGAALAFTRGPRWGLAAVLLGLAPSTVAAAGLGRLLASSAVIGPVTYLVGALVVRRAAVNGYAATEQALAATEAAETAVRVAEQRWDAAREDQRRLHDTVLATLTMLAHRGAGVAPEVLAAACARDAEVLREGRLEPPTRVRTVWLPPLDPDDVAAQRISVQDVVLQGATGARLAGLDVRVHLPNLDDAVPRLDPLVAAAVGEALRECLENVRRHAGVLAADVTVVSEGDTTSVIVVDEGAGFDPAAVAEDRLGLRDTVHEQLRRVGGQATVWSGVGRGTSVLLSVPAAGPVERVGLR